MDITIIVCAAGSGSRFGGDLPKQFCLLRGRPVLMRSIDALRRACPGARIITVLSRDMRQTWRQLCDEYRFGPTEVVDGGATRRESVRNAMLALGPADSARGYVLVHDGARPLVSHGVIRRVIEALDAGNKGAVPAVPVTDTIMMLTGDAGQFGPVDRSTLRCVQTPQGFDAASIIRAYTGTGSTGPFTDDLSVAMAHGIAPVVLTEGDYTNIKVTNPRDLAVAEAMLDESGDET